MNVDRALLTKCIQTGGIATLISRGVSPSLFNQKSPDGQELASVLEWLSDYVKRYNVAPSINLFRERWPTFVMEPSSDPLDALIDSFKRMVLRRAFAAKVMELAHAETDPSKWASLDMIMLDAARDLSALVPSGRVSRFSDMHKRIDRYENERDNPELKRGIKMGIAPFDEVTNGIQKGNLVTIAGFSGIGKSMLSQYFLMKAREQEKIGLLMTLEMTAEEIFERLDTMVVNFSHQLLGRRELPDDQVSLWRRIANQFSSARNDIIVVDRMLGATTDRVYAEINRYKPDVAVVDYVQLMRTRQNHTAQWQALVDITNDLKQIALATDCAIVMVSQDGRSSAEQGSTETNMGGSISVYQAADIYLGLHQTEDMYQQERMEVRLLKNRRGGRQKSANLLWRLRTMECRYEDDQPQHQTFLRVVA